MSRVVVVTGTSTGVGKTIVTSALAAVAAGNVTEAALGYFLNPIVTVALGVVVLHERLRPLQWAAVCVGLVAAVYLSVGTGRVPWVALTLAVTFALYGLTKKRIGATLPALHGLSLETLVLLPVAVVPANASLSTSIWAAIICSVRVRSALVGWVSVSTWKTVSMVTEPGASEGASGSTPYMGASFFV